MEENQRNSEGQRKRRKDQIIQTWRRPYQKVDQRTHYLIITRKGKTQENSEQSEIKWNLRNENKDLPEGTDSWLRYKWHFCEETRKEGRGRWRIVMKTILKIILIFN